MSHRRMTWAEKVAGGRLLAKRAPGYPSWMRLAGVRIGADDLPVAIAAYTTLLAVRGSPLANGGVRFALGRGSVDVVSGPPGLHAVRFVAADGEPPLTAAHGVTV